MDSITQAVLGATVADACLGNILNRKAAWWGLFIGTLPDLDVLARPMLDATQFLSWHRGWSHGVLAICLGPLLLAALLRWCHGAQISWQRAYLACFLVWSTHVLIDCLTVYGTGLWEPFSSQWVEWGLLFIIDPLYTIPLLLATVAALLFTAERRWRPWCTYLALTLSTLYIGWAAIAKTMISNRFAAEIAQANIQAEQTLIAPTLANTFLWRCLIKEQRDGAVGYWIGYASLWDDTDAVHWRWVPSQMHLIEAKRHTPAVQKIQWFSMGYWIAREDQHGLSMIDLRFGETTMAHRELEGVDQPWIFKWRLAADGKEFSRAGMSYPPEFSLGVVWHRICGQRFDWERQKRETASKP